MKARGIFVSLTFILTCALTFLSGCSSGGDDFIFSSRKEITTYSLNSVAGTINEAEKTISVIMPSLTNVYSLVATFTTTGDIVKIGATAQESGVTANNFTSPITYTVTAADGSTVTYTVTVIVNRAWHNPVSLSDNISPDGADAFNHQVAMDDNGNAIIVWNQNCNIYKSEYRNGVWTHPASLNDDISPDYEFGMCSGLDSSSSHPQVAMDNNGNAIIVWDKSDGTNWQIFKSEYRNGAWVNPANLTDHISPDGRVAWLPQVAMDNNGNAIIVWNQSDINHHNKIFKSEYRNGAWVNPANLTDNINPDGYYAEDPQVAMDDNGNAIIVWSQSDGTNEQIFKSEYRNGTWTHPSSLSDNISPDGQSAYLPQVAMDNNGNAIIVWSQSDGTNEQIFKSEYRNGAWTHPASLSDNISPDGQDADAPQVAMDNNGNAIIVWSQSDGTNEQIFKSEYSDGVWHNSASLSSNIKKLVAKEGVIINFDSVIISPAGQNAKYPQVSMDSSGNAVIVWQQSDGTNNQIFKSEYRGGSWTHPASLTDNISPDGQDAGTPQVAMDNNGNAIIVWSQYYGPCIIGWGEDGTCTQIFKSEYR